jgi:hypothetical protein
MEKKVVYLAVERLRREMERGDFGFVQVGPVRQSARRAQEGIEGGSREGGGNRPMARPLNDPTET